MLGTGNNDRAPKKDGPAMKMPRNTFKARLSEPGSQYGIWVSLADAVAAEIAAVAGFDWILIDGEHAPNDIRSILAQLQAVHGYDASPIVRPAEGTTVIIKQLLDIGAQTLLIPMVNTPEQAEELVAATRYPPRGVRGVASARSARWGQAEDYWAEADNEVCLIVQIETPEALDNLEAIAAVDGVDALFVGPSDLGAALGHLGNVGHPDVTAAVSGALSRIKATGKAGGVLALKPDVARGYLDAGASFVGLDVDTMLLSRAAKAIVEEFKNS